MKYQVVKNINGQRENQVIDTYNSLEEAREQLLRELTFAVSDDYTVIENEEAALHEIEVINTEFRKDWGDVRSDSYIAAIESCMGNYPFAVDCVDFDTVETIDDGFYYDNFSIFVEVTGVERDYKPEIIQHLQAMCDEPIDPVIIAIDTIQEGALFVHFAVGDIHQTAIYNPSDDSLFTPSDWQGKRPESEADIEQYNWVNSAWDEAIVMAGLPRVFSAIRDSYRREFGRNVRAAREDKGISQPDLARLSGINQANISRIESGRYNVTLDTIARLSAILGPLT